MAVWLQADNLRNFNCWLIILVQQMLSKVANSMNHGTRGFVKMILLVSFRWDHLTQIKFPETLLQSTSWKTKLVSSIQWTQWLITSGTDSTLEMNTNRSSLSRLKPSATTQSISPAPLHRMYNTSLMLPKAQSKYELTIPARVTLQDLIKFW